MEALDAEKLPRHIAIIPDGNGRWAQQRGLSREDGHRRGTEVMRDTIEAALEFQIPMVTVYAFSTENWDRPAVEVNALMALLKRYLRKEANEFADRGVRIQVIGRVSELSKDLQREVERLERRTENNDGMRVAFALSYSGRTELVDAARSIARAVEAQTLDPDAIDEKTLRAHMYLPDWPDPDLLIRSGAESRISNYLLWQLAYTELYFTDTLWPDFSKQELLKALVEYQRRERRHGLTSDQARSAS
jgi:undecaprenyl diphosphate synthase